MKRIFTMIVLIAMLAAVFAVPVGAQGESRSYLLMANGNKLPANLVKSVSAAGGVVTQTIPEVGLAVATSSDPNFAVRAAKISGLRSVSANLTMQWINPNFQEAVEIDAANPPFSGDDDFFFDLQWGHDAVDAPEAWDAGYRGAGVLVAVLDTGFDMDHPDLAPNINYALSTSFVPGEPVDYTLPDTFSHGTHVAGTIAAADNAFGVIGIAPEAELMLVKVLSDSGSGSFASVIAGIVHAANSGADVINMSLGASLYRSGDCSDPSDCYTAREAAELIVAIGRATTYAYQKGTTVIASAGNNANDGDHDRDLVHIPSDAPHVISISATAPIGWATDPLNAFLDYPASYTNYGQSVIDFAAPGGDYIYPGEEGCVVAGLLRPCWVFDLVFSTGNGGWYWSAGTSMAAPHASGVAALIIGKNGGSMKPAHVEAALRNSADDLGKPGNDDFYGAGRVNAFNAVR